MDRQDSQSAELTRIYSLRLCVLATLVSTSFTVAAPPTTQPVVAKGTRTASVATGYEIGLGSTIIPSVQLGANYFFVDNFSIGIEGAVLGVGQPGDDAVALGVSGVLRHFLAEWDRTRLFMDLSFGPYEASDRVPEGGTRFNFITRVGPGVTYQLDETTHLMAGVRYWHLSNARIEGVDHNPSLNACEVSIGLTWNW
jgi:hypothetical protein